MFGPSAMVACTVVLCVFRTNNHRKSSRIHLTPQQQRQATYPGDVRDGSSVPTVRVGVVHIHLLDGRLLPGDAIMATDDVHASVNAHCGMVSATHGHVGADGPGVAGW